MNDWATRFTGISGGDEENEVGEFLLVLQFPLVESDLARFDALVALEAELRDWMGPDMEIDGHDRGGGELNIFVFTDDPGTAFERAMMLLQARPQFADVRIAFRDIESDAYTVLWPEDLFTFEVQ